MTNKQQKRQQQLTCPAHTPEVKLYGPLPDATAMERHFRVDRVHPTDDGRLHFAAAAVLFSLVVHSIPIVVTEQHRNCSTTRHTTLETVVVGCSCGLRK